MADISIPEFKVKSQDLQLVRGDAPIQFMNGAEVIMAPAFALWVLSAPLPVLQEAAAKDWRAALAQLSKLSNTFKVQPADYDGPGTGYAGADPVVNGGSQMGTSLVCDGVSLSTAIVQTGDFLEVNGEFKIVTADASSDGAGNVTISFEPALRSAPADGATVDIQTPQLNNMRLVDPRAAWSVRPPKLYDIQIHAIESFGP